MAFLAELASLSADAQQSVAEWVHVMALRQKTANHIRILGSDPHGPPERVEIEEDLDTHPQPMIGRADED